MIKSAKGVEINKKLICYTYLHILVQTCFWPFKLQNLIMCLKQKFFILIW
jgi:hypothetical protein